MAHRNPARFLAPLALVAFAVTLVLVVQHASDTGGSSSSTSAPVKSSGRSNSTSRSRKHKARHSKPRSYVVKSGDTPSGIAAKTGVSLVRLQELNPSLDPQALSVGERLKLR
jgi:LysM repeat protein